MTAPALEETIVAVSTPPGRALRAVVRLSGPRARAIASGSACAVAFPAPRTYTREDVVEIHLPGSPPLVDRLVRRLVERGARPARPGEFTLRAFLNGRLDLARAEAVEQLISAEDEQDRRAALDQLQGSFSRRVRAIEDAVMDLCADAEAAIDFVDQEIEILPVEQAQARAAEARENLARLLAESAAKRVAGDRPTAVLFGRPNAGKSSLFNALTGGKALATEVAGTTRDLLAADLPGGIRLLDAAGVFEGGSPSGPDAEASRRAEDAMRRADLVVWVVDAADGEASRDRVPAGRPTLLAVSKCDVTAGEAVRTRLPIRESVCTSARTGEGVDALRRKLGELLGEGGNAAVSARFRVNLRQRALLREAEGALDRAAGSAPGLGMEFVSLDLRAALDALGSITGRQVGEDLLDRIFSRFCLGK